MKIAVYNRQTDLKINKSSVRALVGFLLDYLKISCEEISLYFVTQKKISSLHAEFFEDPTPTDCISFPLDGSHLGEIFICPAAAVQYVKEKGGDPYSETALYIAHGILHLIGFDDLEEKKRRAMRKKEKSCMDHLQKAKIKLG